MSGRVGSPARWTPVAGAPLAQRPAGRRPADLGQRSGASLHGGRARGWSRVGWLAGDVCGSVGGLARFAGGERNAASSCSGWMTATAGPCGGWHLPVWAHARVQAVIFLAVTERYPVARRPGVPWNESWTGRGAHWVRSVLSERLGVRSVQLCAQGGGRANGKEKVYGSIP